MKEIWWVVREIGCFCWIMIWAPVISLLLIMYVKKPNEMSDDQRGFPMVPKSKDDKDDRPTE